MGRLSYLTIILALVILCVLPLYCELKNEETLNLNLMEGTDDVHEAMRIKRGIQIFNSRPDSPFDIFELKQTQKEKKASKQKVGDSKTVKFRNEMKPQSRDEKKRTQHKISVKQGNEPDADPQKSVLKKNIKSIGNKKSQPVNDGRKNKQKSIVLKIKNIKRVSRTMIKSKNLNKKSVKREIILNSSKDLKYVAKKKGIVITNKTVNDLQENTLDGTSRSKDTDNEIEDEGDKAYVDENGAFVISYNTKGNNNKGEVNEPSYYKTFSRFKQGTLGKRNKENAEEYKEEYDDGKELKIKTIHDQMKYRDGNKKYNKKDYKNTIHQEKLSPKYYIALVKKIKLEKKI